MLHTGILPHHTNWLEFFANLKFIVIDEAHTYRGVFGSHVANVIRRIKRVANFYGARPQFILASATIGNPKELAEKLIEESVTQEKGTERAFTGKYSAHTARGTYYCVCCDADLFESEKKFDAGCGWPSFWLPLAGDRIRQHRDLSHGMVRTEVTCAA